MTLPPLPPPDLGTVRIGRVDQDMGHSADQMRAYGEACALAERNRIRRALQDMQAACRSHNYYAHAIVAAGLTPGTTTAAPVAPAPPPPAS